MSRLRLLILTLLALALAAVPAQASHTQTLTFEAPRELLAPTLLQSGFDDVAALGARRLRIVLYWKDVAPSPDASSRPSFDATDPAAYNWAKYDPAIEEADRRGWPVLLTVSGPVPKWATLGRRDYTTRPDPAQFGRFMQAVAKKYGGKVSQFAIWNEPNLPAFLKPQFFKGEVASPQWYRKLVVAGIKGLEDGGLADPSVLLGETAPRGNRFTVAPITFLRQMLCLSASYKRDTSCAKLDVAGYAHHAYTTRAGPFFVPARKEDVTIGVLSRLVAALDKAGKAGALPKKLPIYLTEFGIQSVPDPNLGVSQQKQAEFRATSERLAWDQPRVRSFSQYLLRDDLPRAGEDRYSGFESGLRFSGGGRKLAHTAFPVPLSALRRGSTVSLWGLARLAGERTKVTVLSGRKKFSTYRTYTTDARGYFTAKVPYVKGRAYKLRWTSDDGKTHTGPATRVYTRPSR